MRLLPRDDNICWLPQQSALLAGADCVGGEFGLLADGGGESGGTIGLATETMSLQKVTIDRVLRLLEAVGLEASVKVRRAA